MRVFNLSCTQCSPQLAQGADNMGVYDLLKKDATFGFILMHMHVVLTSTSFSLTLFKKSTV